MTQHYRSTVLQEKKFFLMCESTRKKNDHKPVKTHSTLVIREIQIKTTMRYYFTPTRMDSYNKKDRQ